MKKLIITAALACILAPVFAVSWGGLLDNSTGINANHDFSTISLAQSNGLHLYANAPLNNTGTMKLVAEGSAKYTLNNNFKSNDATFKFILDCDLLKFSGKWITSGGSVSLDLGRFTMADFSGVVFAQKSDGLYLSYNSQKLKAGLYGGYTGLQNRLNVSMLDNDFDKDDNIYKLSAAYIPLMVDLSYKALFETHTIGLQGEFFIPLKDTYTKKLYGSLLLSGPIGLMASYSLKGTFGLEKMERPMLDALAELNIYLNTSSILTAGVEFISFESDGLKQFTTVSSRSISRDPLFASGIVPKLSFVYAKNRLYASLAGKGLLAMTKKDTKFHGIDASAGVLYNLFSDLQIGLDLGAYIGAGDFKESSNYSATLKASLAF